jgi:para-nitrobenzyl esterase
VRGAGSIPKYDGTSFARNGTVCVTINYRLGAPGFLDVGDETANIGLRDQIAALAWVQENISAFGGDPSRVTLAGQSAGAMSIGALLGSPLASGLFEAAILESGAAHHALSRTTARAVAATLADILGVEPDRAAFSAVPLDDLLAAVEALDARLRSSPDQASVREVLLNGMPFSPSVDGSVLPQAPLDAIRQGSASSVRLLVGTTTEENRLFLAPGGAIDRVEGGVLDRVAQSYGIPADASVRELYQDEQDPSPGVTLSALQTDWMFRIPAIRLAEAQH